MDENTVVFFSSDNGQKRQLFEGGIRVPGMIRWSGQIKPRISELPNSTLDVLPTICDLAGIESPKDRALDGSSLKEHLLHDKAVERAKPLYWQFDPLRTDWELTGERYDRRFDGTQPKHDPKALSTNSMTWRMRRQSFSTLLARASSSAAILDQVAFTPDNVSSVPAIAQLAAFSQPQITRIAADDLQSPYTL